MQASTNFAMWSHSSSSKLFFIHCNDREFGQDAVYIKVAQEILLLVRRTVSLTLTLAFSFKIVYYIIPVQEDTPPVMPLMYFPCAAASRHHSHHLARPTLAQPGTDVFFSNKELLSKNTDRYDSCDAWQIILQ
jgi:hypothetical protein